MIEGESDFVGEDQMMKAIEVGHAAVKVLCEGEAYRIIAPSCFIFCHFISGQCSSVGTNLNLTVERVIVVVVVQ